jgi:NAD(P)-dependent dehydrogenase (short-subunit alcohol dehydrogenase family)
MKSQFGKSNAAWAVVKHGAPKLAGGGSITLFSGALSRSISEGASCLGPVNAAIECFTKRVAKELAPRLRVNCVSPGLTRTNAVTGGMAADQAEGAFVGYGKSIPAGRSGNAEDLGHAVAFLMANCFMSGHLLDGSGGSCT